MKKAIIFSLLTATMFASCNDLFSNHLVPFHVSLWYNEGLIDNFQAKSAFDLVSLSYEYLPGELGKDVYVVNNSKSRVIVANVEITRDPYGMKPNVYYKEYTLSPGVKQRLGNTYIRAEAGFPSVEYKFEIAGAYFGR